jgi:heme exporter protein CcmD
MGAGRGMMDHQFYLWMSYGATAIALVAEIVALRMGRARVRRMVEEERDLEAQD